MASTNKSKENSQEDSKVIKYYLQPSDLVIESIEEAELLLSFAAERGLNLTEEHIKVITEAKLALEKKQWNTDIEIRFWMIYRQLTSNNYPVSVESVRAARKVKINNPNFFQKIFKKKYKQPLTYRTVRIYSFATITTLLIMVVLHILFSIGTIRLKQIQKSTTALQEIEKQLEDIDIIGSGEMINQNIEIKKEKILNKLYQINSEKENAIRLLEDWLRFMKKITFSEKKFEQRLLQKDILTNRAPPNIADQAIDTRIGIIQEAQNYVMVLGFYILPLFYGLLGALAFVLRDLAITTRKIIFTKDANINHTLRIMLGTIAGLAVGVFWGEISEQNNLIGVKTLGPLLAAFIAGFTVEYVFALIETAMRSFFERTITKSKSQVK